MLLNKIEVLRLCYFSMKFDLISLMFLVKWRVCSGLSMCIKGIRFDKASPLGRLRYRWCSH